MYVCINLEIGKLDVTEILFTIRHKGANIIAEQTNQSHRIMLFHANRDSSVSDWVDKLTLVNRSPGAYHIKLLSSYHFSWVKQQPSMDIGNKSYPVWHNIHYDTHINTETWGLNSAKFSFIQRIIV